MDTVSATLLVIVGITLAAGGSLHWANRRFRANPDTLVDALDALLPQTQCAQCGYPGCRPYAEAMAVGESINLCPPGGTSTHRELGKLLAASAEGRDLPPCAVAAQKAVIDETRCIGCFLCVQACPVDAIVGAPQLMHTVLEEICTGCELCIAPCPVDCIDLTAAPMNSMTEQTGEPRPRSASACIRCGRCEQECPVDLRRTSQRNWSSGARRSPQISHKSSSFSTRSSKSSGRKPTSINSFVI